MQKVLIIEDDHFSARRLKRLIMDIDDTIDVHGPLKSVVEVTEELTALIDTEIPNYSRQKDNRTFHEEIALLAYPTSIEVKHYRVACFVGIRNVRHEAGIYRVASVALAWVVKIDNVKFRLNLVAVQVVK